MVCIAVQPSHSEPTGAFSECHRIKWNVCFRVGAFSERACSLYLWPSPCLTANRCQNRPGEHGRRPKSGVAWLLHTMTLRNPRKTNVRHCLGEEMPELRIPIGLIGWFVPSRPGDIRWRDQRRLGARGVSCRIDARDFSGGRWHGADADGSEGA